MNLTARIARCIEKHPDWTADRVQRCIPGSRMADIRARLSPAAPSAGKASPPPAGGLETLREQFGREEITRRRVGRLQQQVARFISTTLKKRKWMKDVDVRAELAINPIDYALVRQEHTALLMEPVDENRRKVLIWVHPDHLDEAHDIINGTKEK